MKTVKTKIKRAVMDYVKANPKEYKSFLKGMRAKAELMKDGKELRGHVERPLYETPEILHYMIKNSLEEEEWSWFMSLDDYQGNFDGSKWFTKRFPQFSLIKKF